MIEPPKRVAQQQIAPREYIFILDVSGSMNGFPLDVAKTLMKELFSGLRSNDYFNVLLFAGGNRLFAEQSVPHNSANLIAKRPIVLFGKYLGTPSGKIVVSGRCGKKKYQNEIRVSEGNVSTKNRALRYLWARHQIRRLSDMEKISKNSDITKRITQLGLDYNLPTDYTSFVAVDTEKRTEGKPEITVKQPLPLPEGVSNNAVGVMKMRRMMPAGDQRQRLMEKIQGLEEKKQKLRSLVRKKSESMKAPRKSITEVIARYEKLRANCTVRKSERCADVIYTLGTLYYDKARDEFSAKQEEYAKVMKRYEQNSESEKPVPPEPDYSQALGMYEKLITEYPDFKKLSEAYYQTGSMYLLMDDPEKAKDAFAIVAVQYPNSPRRSTANYRLSELCYKDKDYPCTKKTLEKIKESQVDKQTWETVHYRKAEVYFNTGKYSKALNLFFSYIEKCDAGLYPKKKYLDMAIELMGCTFAEMKNGMSEAKKFFKKNGTTPCEPVVYITMGERYYSQKKYRQAMEAFNYALKKYPMYKGAPDVTLKLIECFNSLKNVNKAEEERNRLVKEYGPDSKWAETHSADSTAIKKARAAIKKVTKK